MVEKLSGEGIGRLREIAQSAAKSGDVKDDVAPGYDDVAEKAAPNASGSPPDPMSLPLTGLRGGK